MDLVSYCTLDETKQIDYSVAKPLNREPPARDLVSRYSSLQVQSPNPGLMRIV